MILNFTGNYGNDRIATFLYKNIFEFISNWTNLQFYTLPPIQLVKQYFEFFPEEREPIWTNPCESYVSLRTWFKNESECTRLPKIVIIGPDIIGNKIIAG